MLSDLFETVPDALIIVDAHGVITRANRHAEVLFGYPAEGLAGQSIEVLMPQELRNQHQVHRAGYVKNPRVRPMGAMGQALIGLRMNGERFPIEIALSPIETEQGVRYLASVRDVSETQRAQQAIVRAKYDAVIARIGQLALESRSDGGIVDQIAAQLLETLQADSIVVAFNQPGTKDIELRTQLAYRSEWPEPLSLYDKANQRGIVRAATHDGHVTVLSDQTAINIHGVASIACIPLLDRDQPMGAILALSALPNQFTPDAMHLLQSAAYMIAAYRQRKHTEEQLAHSQRLDAIGQLTGGIAHDFNNLLTVISGSLQLLEVEFGENSSASALIGSALRSVSRGAELTNKLLAFARRQRLVPQALQPRELLDDLSSMLGRTLGESIAIDVECAADMPYIFADISQLDSAIVNLALNARDAMSSGGRLQIRGEPQWVSSDDLTDELKPGLYGVISVIDNGSGMSADVLARAIEPFYTTKESGRGSGLGLSMVYGFMKQTGGHLQIKSSPGIGTRIDLFFPATDAPAAKSEITEPNTWMSGTETILVVEDEVDVATIASAFLRSFGYHVRAASTAEEALQVLSTEPNIHLIFSDVMLGNGMNGFELAKSVRQSHPQLPILLTSGYGHSAIGTIVPDESQFELLRKPYRREQLAVAVRRSLDQAV
jgi:PAS domain S-box-containing protein